MSALEYLSPLMYISLITCACLPEWSILVAMRRELSHHEQSFATTHIRRTFLDLCVCVCGEGVLNLVSLQSHRNRAPSDDQTPVRIGL